MSINIKKLSNSLGKGLQSLGKTLKKSFSSKIQYKNASQLEDLTPAQILNLDPKIVSSSIENTSMHNLSKNQKEALKKLIVIKRIEQSLKGSPDTKQKVRKQYLNTLPTIQENTDQLVVKETMKHVRDSAKMHQLENRLRTLKHEPPVEMSFDEMIVLKMDKPYKSKSPKTKKGGKNKKTYKNKK
jgi:aspartate-semialdehyde dehydrogenase